MRNLIKLIFIVSLMSAPALAATLRVPGDYSTIQEAVDAAEAGDIIMVGPGEYSGAYIDRVPVVIEGSGQATRIVWRNDYPHWNPEEAFTILGQGAPPDLCPAGGCGADGTQIRNLMIDGSGGAFVFGFFSFRADHVQLEDITIVTTPFSVRGYQSDYASVKNLEIVDSYHGIASWYGNGWTIEDNTLIGVATPPWSGSRHFDMILVAGQGQGHVIWRNTIYHEGDAVCTGEPESFCGLEDDERYIGVALVAWSGPMDDNVVAENSVTIQVEGDGIDGQAAVALVDYSLLEGGPALVKGNDIVYNALGGECLLEFVPSELSELNLVYNNECRIIDVIIDIKPGSDPNSINLKSKGNIPVAVLSSDTFDATQVDWETALFGPDSASESHGGARIEDVNGDGIMDSVFHFKTQETGIACDDTEAALTGETFGGVEITGTDSIQIVKCP